jgi:hypothetical protein
LPPCVKSAPAEKYGVGSVLYCCDEGFFAAGRCKKFGFVHVRVIIMGGV